MPQSDEIDFSIRGWPKSRRAAIGLALGRLASWPSSKVKAMIPSGGTGVSGRAKKMSAVLLAAMVFAQLFAATVVVAQHAICGEDADCENETGDGGRGGAGGDLESESGGFRAGDARGGDASLGGGGNGGDGGGGGAAGGSGTGAGSTIGGRGGGGDGGPGGAGNWSCVSIGGSARSGDARSENRMENTGGSSTAPITANAPVANTHPKNKANPRNAGDAASRVDQSEKGEGDNNAGRNENIPVGGDSNGCSAVSNANGGSNVNNTSTAVNSAGSGGRGARSGDVCGSNCPRRRSNDTTTTTTTTTRTSTVNQSESGRGDFQNGTPEGSNGEGGGNAASTTFANNHSSSGSSAGTTAGSSDADTTDANQDARAEAND